MKKVLLCAAFIAASFTSIAQIGIGTTTPDDSAALEIFSSSKGLLLPRLTTAQRNAIEDPVLGLAVYCIDCGLGAISFYNGASWSGVSEIQGRPNTQVKADNLGGTFTFLSHNLGADTTLNPHVPNEHLNGDYYQWGKKVPDATTDGWTTEAWGDADGTTVYTNWIPNEKTIQDPCPEGYRVPSALEWQAVINSNIATRTGSWNGTEFGLFTNALHFGPNTITKKLTLPAAGFYRNNDGVLTDHNESGSYWTSSNNSNDEDPMSFTLNFTNVDESTAGLTFRTEGQSVRCIAQ